MAIVAALAASAAEAANVRPIEVRLDGRTVTGVLWVEGLDASPARFSRCDAITPPVAAPMRRDPNAPIRLVLAAAGANLGPWRQWLDRALAGRGAARSLSITFATEDGSRRQAAFESCWPEALDRLPSGRGDVRLRLRCEPAPIS